MWNLWSTEWHWDRDETNSNSESLQPYSTSVATVLLDIGTTAVSAVLSFDGELG
jgi:hypothetical protein